MKKSIVSVGLAVAALSTVTASADTIRFDKRGTNFSIDGNQMNKFHTTRVAIVKKFSNQKLRDDINSGNETLHVKCVLEKSTSGKNFFNLVDA